MVPKVFWIQNTSSRRYLITTANLAVMHAAGNRSIPTT